MASPGDNYINQAVDEVVAALTAHPAFMSPNAENPPLGAVGSIVFVEDDAPPKTTKIPNQRLPHAGVVYLGHKPGGDDSRGTTSYEVEIGIRLYNRGTDRKAVWSALHQAAAAVSKVVEDELRGDRFNGLAVLAWDTGGDAIDMMEEGGFGAALYTGIVLKIYRNTP